MYYEDNDKRIDYDKKKYDDDSYKMSPNTKKWLIIIAIIGILILVNKINKASDDFTATDLYNAQKKYLNGEKLSRTEENMVEGFYKWKAEENRYDD